MSEPLPLYAQCRHCGGSRTSAPAEFGENSLMTCYDCERPVVGWLEYKKRAMAEAATALRRLSVTSGRR